MVFEGFSTENKKLVQTVTTSAETLGKDIFESHTDRLSSRGGHFTAEQQYEPHGPGGSFLFLHIHHLPGKMIHRLRAHCNRDGI